MSRHDWTEIDEEILIDAITRLEPMLEHYRSLGSRKTHEGQRPGSWWDTVAGALVVHHEWSGGPVSGAACRKRYQHITDSIGVLQTPDQMFTDGWARVEALVDEYERTVGEATYEEVREMRSRLDVLAAAVSVLAEQVQGLREVWDGE